MNKYLSILLFFVSITCSAQVHIIYNLVDSVGGGGSGGGSGTLTSLQYINPAEGLLITGTNPATTSATWTFSLANDLGAFEALSGTGIAVRTGLNTWAQRTLVQGFGILITNPDGVSGNITIAATDSQSLSISGNQLTLSRGNTITLPSGGGSGTTDLSLNGTSSIDTLRSSTGTDVNFQAGQGITFDISIANKLIMNAVRDELNFTGTSATIALTTTTSSLGGVTFQQGANMTITQSGNIITFASTAGGGGSSNLSFSGTNPVSLTAGATPVTFTNGGGLNFSSSANNLTISAQSQIQHITWSSIIAGGAGSGSATVNLDLLGGNISLVAGSNISFANSGGSLQINSSTGALSGSGTTNFISKWTSSTNLSNSTIQDNGSTIGMNGTAPVAGILTQWPSGDIKIGINAGTTNRLLFGDGSFVYIGEESSDDRMVIHAGTLMFNLTSGGGTGINGQVLTSNGTTASWQTPSSGSNIAPLSWTSITSGSATLSAGSTTVNFLASGSTTFANSGGSLQISSTGGGGSVGPMSLSGGLIFTILGLVGSSSMAFQGSTVASGGTGISVTNTGTSGNSNLLFSVADVSPTNEIQHITWSTINTNTATATLDLSGGAITFVNGSNVTFANVGGNLQINANLAGGAVSGSGSTNFLSKWSGASSLVNSLISDNGTSIFLTSLTSNGYVKTAGSTGQLFISTSIPGSDISGNISGNAASITGSITESQVTSLVSDLASKQSLITTGSTLQYFRGDLSLATFPTTTASFANSTNKNFVTDAQLTVINGISGTNTGDQTITLTTDVTGSGTGTFATTIAAGAVTLAKMANVATGTIFYRKSAGTGGVELNTLATLKTDLGLTGTNTGDQTLSWGSFGSNTASITLNTGSISLTTSSGINLSGSVGGITLSNSTSQNISILSNLLTNGYVKTTGSSGTLSVSTSIPGSDITSITESQVTNLVTDLSGKQPNITLTTTGTSGAATFVGNTLNVPNYATGGSTTLTGDVTGSGTGTFATTIAAGAVTLAKMANVATSTLFYRRSAGTGGVELNTLAQLKSDLGLTGTNSGDVNYTSGGAGLTVVGSVITNTAPHVITNLSTSQSGSNILITPTSGSSGTSIQLNAGTGIALTNINGSISQVALSTGSTQTFSSSGTVNGTATVAIPTSSGISISVPSSNLYDGRILHFYNTSGGSVTVTGAANGTVTGSWLTFHMVYASGFGWIGFND